MTRERVLESLLRDLLTYDVDHLADISVPCARLRLRPRSPAPVAGLGRRRRRAGREPRARLATAADPRGLPHWQDISASLSSVSHVVLRRHEPGQKRSRGVPVALARGSCAQVGRRARIGIGGVARTVDEIAASYAEALTALRLGSSLGLVSPYDIDDMRVERDSSTARPAGARPGQQRHHRVAARRRRLDCDADDRRCLGRERLRRSSRLPARSSPSKHVGLPTAADPTETRLADHRSTTLARALPCLPRRQPGRVSPRCRLLLPDRGRSCGSIGTGRLSRIGASRQAV